MTQKIEPGPYTPERFLAAWADGRRVVMRDGRNVAFLAHDQSAQAYAPSEPAYSLVVREDGRTGFGARHADGRMNKFREDQHDLVILAKEPEPVVRWTVECAGPFVTTFHDETEARCFYEGRRDTESLLKITRYPGQKRAEAVVVEERGHG